MDTNRSFLQIHPNDNVLVALRDLPPGMEIDFQGERFALISGVKAKHKFVRHETVFPTNTDY